MSYKFSEELKDLEQRVWLDVTIARASFEIVASFLKPLQQESSEHFRKRDFPFVHPVSWACFDSVIASLGRLFNDSPHTTEATLKKLVEYVKAELASGKVIERHSSFSKKSAENLQDREVIRRMNNKFKALWKKIEDLRHKVVSHSDLSFPYGQLPNLMPDVTELIDFAEETHRMCISALSDSCQSGPYLNAQFKEIARNWIDALKSRER